MPTRHRGVLCMAECLHGVRAVHAVTEESDVWLFGDCPDCCLAFQTGSNSRLDKGVMPSAGLPLSPHWHFPESSLSPSIVVVCLFVCSEIQARTLGINSRDYASP